MANLPKRGCVTPVSIMRDVWDPLGVHLNQKDLKSGGWVMANLPKGGCVTEVSIIRDVRHPLGLYLIQNDLQLGKKWQWLSYGQSTNERLRESS